MRNRKGRTRQALIVGTVALGTVGAIACGPFFGPSIHFDNGTVDFGAPVPNVILVSSDGYDDPFIQRPVVSSSELRGEYPEELIPRLESLNKRSKQAEDKGDFAGALTIWKKYAAIVTPEATLYSQLPDGEFARRRVEVLSLDPVPEGLAEFLKQTQGMLTGSNPSPVSPQLQAWAAKSEGPLAAQAWYALGAVSYDNGDFRDAAPFYEKASTFAGPRQEPSIIMSIRCRLADGTPSAESIEAAKTAMQRLRTEFPKSRFLAELPGWELRLAFLAKDHAGAFTGYLRQLGDAKDLKTRVSALSSIRAVTKSLTDDDAKAIRAKILKDPELLSPYLDYRLYHTKATTSEYAALASFVREVLAAHPRATIAGPILARLAETEYLNGHFDDAGSFAAASLSKTDQSRADLATYIRASVLRKTGNLYEARAVLKGYETKYKGSYLVKSALEQQALVHEKFKDWAAAADDYRKLDYPMDIAYILDVRMTPQQAEKYADSISGSKNRFLLAAGFRYLRVADWKRAEALFLRIPTKVRKALVHAGTRDFSWNNTGPIDKVPDPLTTTRDLHRLSKDRSAKGMYAFASYYYDHRNLLLYNGNLWDSMHKFVGYGWNPKVASAADDAALLRHHYDHECLFHAQQICLALARRYPKSPEAPKAIYRAATAGRRLASFNPYWRRLNVKHDRYAEAADLMRRVYRDYPASSLAKTARKYESVFRKEGKANDYDEIFAR